MNSNLKDTLTTVFGIIGVICGAIISVATAGVALPVWLLTSATVGGAISVGGIGWMTGKTPAGTTKTVNQVAEGNAGNAPK